MQCPPAQGASCQFFVYRIAFQMDAEAVDGSGNCMKCSFMLHLVDVLFILCIHYTSCASNILCVWLASCDLSLWIGPQDSNHACTTYCLFSFEGTFAQCAQGAPGIQIYVPAIYRNA